MCGWPESPANSESATSRPRSSDQANAESRVQNAVQEQCGDRGQLPPTPNYTPSANRRGIVCVPERALAKNRRLKSGASQKRRIRNDAGSSQVISAIQKHYRFHGWRAGRTKRPNIPQGRLAEQAAVFAVELAGTFVADLKGRTCGIQPIKIFHPQRLRVIRPDPGDSFCRSMALLP